MLVTVTDIIAKIKELPDDYPEHVHMSKPGTAFVDSFTDPLADPYHVSIKRTKKEGERDVRCSCPARTLCKHIPAFYAVAKGIKPDGSIQEAKKDKDTDEKAKETLNKHAKKVLTAIDSMIEALDSLELAFDKLAMAAKAAKEYWEKQKEEK